MFLNKISSRRLHQLGLGLPATLFIITIMSFIALAVNRINESTSQSFSQNILSTRAFYAAESGAQLRVRDVLVGPPCICGADVDYQFSVAGLASCQANTVCSSFSVNSQTYCTVVSTGICDGGSAMRSIEVRVK